MLTRCVCVCVCVHSSLSLCANTKVNRDCNSPQKYAQIIITCDDAVQTLQIYDDIVYV